MSMTDCEMSRFGLCVLSVRLIFTSSVINLTIPEPYRTFFTQVDNPATLILDSAALRVLDAVCKSD
jgi:hypothetical protein